LTARAHAVLELYHETALLLHSILRAEHIAVIDATVKAIESFKSRINSFVPPLMQIAM
jgi:hypothetical protein